MKAISIFAAVAVFACIPAAGFAESPGAGAGAISIGDARGGYGSEGRSADRPDRGDIGGGRGNDGGGQARGAPSRAPAIEDSGSPTPPIIRPGEGTEGIVEYDDGSFDVVDVDPVNDTITIERYDRAGMAVGSEGGRASGYFNSISGEDGDAPMPAPAAWNYSEPLGQRCLTPAGVSPPGPTLPLGAPCNMPTPYGIAFGYVVA